MCDLLVREAEAETTDKLRPLPEIYDENFETKTWIGKKRVRWMPLLGCWRFLVRTMV